MVLPARRVFLPAVPVNFQALFFRPAGVTGEADRRLAPGFKDKLHKTSFFLPIPAKSSNFFRTGEPNRLSIRLNKGMKNLRDIE
ncbi:hypothetical protein A6M21_09235 [Desulfotomaculum copahuensis]|uniref:Uncharacterized protein n=1 Tax=Desulfotomaculum copahuensis TaxID=1838280 RepID=A0A1B7LFF6_9FIRM|nr:hypothetical protein A6M21_09235 [Desulfotomaculum copahuensis]